MKAVVQIVKKASVTISNKVVAEVQAGFLILLGIEVNDVEKDADLLIEKLVNLRTFTNLESQKFFDFSLLEVKADTLIVSQFTIPATFKKGRRPEFSAAMNPKDAKKLYDYFVEFYKGKVDGLKVETGEFGAEMIVGLENDGPITYVLNSSDLY